MPRLLLVCLGLIGFAAPVSALSIRRRLAVLAYSEDGQSVLVDSRGDGPEGGGSEALELWSATAPHRQRFELSSTFSPGDGSEPQTIDVKACTSRLGELEQTLKKRGFKDVTIRSEACAKRGDYLVTQPRHAEAVNASQFEAVNKKLVHGAYEVRFSGQQVSVMKGEVVQCTISRPKNDLPSNLVARQTKSGFVFFIERSADRYEGLFAMCGGEPMKRLDTRDSVTAH